MTRKPKILFVMGHFTVGGAEKQWAQYLSTRPEDADYDLEIITILPSQSDVVEKSFRDLGVKITLIDRSTMSFRTFLWQLYLEVKRAKPTIVHSILEGSTGTWGRLTAILAGVPHIMHSDLGQSSLAPSIHTRLRPFLDARTRHFTPNAYSLADWLKASGVPENKITVMPNVTDVHKFNPARAELASLRQDLGIPNDALVAGFIAAFRQEKRLDILLDALLLLEEHERPDYFIFGGDGEMMPMVQERINKDAWLKEHCKLLGMVEDTPRFFASIDYLVLTSEREGTPNVVLEAQAMEKPVVATDVADLALMLEGSGFLANRNDPKSIAEAMRKMNTLSPEERQKMGQKGRQQVVKRHELKQAGEVFWQAHTAFLGT